jgi:hypothetical protein
MILRKFDSLQAIEPEPPPRRVDTNGGGGGDDDNEAVAKVPADLLALLRNQRMSSLMGRARALGAPQRLLDEALDSDDQRAALVGVYVSSVQALARQQQNTGAAAAWLGSGGESGGPWYREGEVAEVQASLAVSETVLIFRRRALH